MAFIKDKISGERYQDHWSSGYVFIIRLFMCIDELFVGANPILALDCQLQAERAKLEET